MNLTALFVMMLLFAVRIQMAAAGAPPRREVTVMNDVGTAISMDSAEVSSLGGTKGRMKANTRIGPTYTEYMMPDVALLAAMQSDCSRPMVYNYVVLHQGAGLGSELHTWGGTAEIAQHEGMRLVVPRKKWKWLDYSRGCTASNNPLQCYFKLEKECPFGANSNVIDTELEGKIKTLGRDVEKITFFGYGGGCEIKGNDGVCNLFGFRRRYKHAPNSMSYGGHLAAMEYLFASGMTNRVMREVGSQMMKIFGKNVAPKNLITVFIRWGDKQREMPGKKLFSIEPYVEATRRLLTGRQRNPKGAADIYISSEDPRACKAFRKSAEKAWKVHCDAMVEEMEKYRPAEGNNAVEAQTRSRGAEGTAAFASLVVALEADDYVLTLSSNWGRLMNELRVTIVDRLCNKCTRMIYLDKAKHGKFGPMFYRGATSFD
jgi:hypothetical protein